MLGARLAPKVLKILGKTAGSAIAGTAVDRVAKKIFGGGRARRRLRRMLQHRRRRTRGRGRRRRMRGRGLFTSLLGRSAIRWMGGKPVRTKRRRNPVHRIKSWATSKAKSWIAKKVRKHLGVGGGRGRAAYGGRGLRLFSAPGLVRRKPFNFQTTARKRKAGTGSTSRGGCRYHKRRHYRRRRR